VLEYFPILLVLLFSFLCVFLSEWVFLWDFSLLNSDIYTAGLVPS